MEFTLTYTGPLRPNARADHKHAIRRHFHPQLKRLWEQLPLSGYRQFLSDPPTEGALSVIDDHHGFRFASLVSERLHFVAALDITVLRPEEPGRILSQSGDLDNRVKTLLDALKVPHEPNALPIGEAPAEGETPFYCLLQDDALVVSLAVRTDRWLEPVRDPTEVLALVRVRTSSVRSLVGTLGM